MISILAKAYSSGLSPVCVNNCGLPTPGNTQGHGPIDTVLQIAFGILGAAALLVITIAGLRYVTSGGDPQRAANARSNIVYALVGLAIAIFAEAIINYVVKAVS